RDLSDFLKSLFKKNNSADKEEATRVKEDSSNELNTIEDNKHAKNQQTKKKIYMLLFAIAATLLVINLVAEKKIVDIKKDNPDPKVEVAAGGIKPEKMWLTHLEEKIRK